MRARLTGALVVRFRISTSFTDDVRDGVNLGARGSSLGGRKRAAPVATFRESTRGMSAAISIEHMNNIAFDTTFSTIDFNQLQDITGGEFKWGEMFRAGAGGAVTGAVGGAVGGAVTGSFAGGVGAGPGALAGGVAGGIGGGIAAMGNNVGQQLGWWR